MLKLFNTLTRKKEAFKSIKNKEVGIYACGLTVYDYAHIGNLRTYIFEDILKRVLLYNKYKVRHVMNITDVGHLTSDADEGEDKLIKALKREGKPLNVESMKWLANFYTKVFQEDIKKLNILFPDIWCKATEHIKEMIALIKKIEANGYTYPAGGNLYFDISKFKDYSKLGRLRLKKLKTGARVDVDIEKRNPHDFVLWFTASKFKGHVMQWDSPWGRGFPGWHIECSAMSIKYLGKHFDIHCGGIDHIPIHHTNEIAQSEAATGKNPWVNYWIHGEFLVMNKEKMSKSKGKFLTLSSLIERGYEPLIYRYFCLTASYKQQLSFSWEALDSAKNSFASLREKVLELKNKLNSKGKDKIKIYKNKFLDEINDDLNVPRALATLWKVIKDNELGSKEKLELIYDFDKVFGLKLKQIKKEKIPKNILELVKKREDYRNKKNWERSDEIRKEIEKKGYVIEDSEKGPKIKKKPF